MKAEEWFKENGELLEFKHKDAKGNDTGIVLTFVTHAAAERYAREFAAAELEAAYHSPVEVLGYLLRRIAELKG